MALLKMYASYTVPGEHIPGRSQPMATEAYRPSRGNIVQVKRPFDDKPFDAKIVYVTTSLSAEDEETFVSFEPQGNAERLGPFWCHTDFIKQPKGRKTNPKGSQKSS